MRWRWAALLVVVVGLIGGMFWWRHARQVEQLRSGMEQLHRERVAPAAARIGEFRHRLEGWITTAATKEPEPWADPDLKISDLHGAQGVYLRIPADAARSPEAIRQAAREMQPDAITRCLGLNPISLRGMYERLEFLSPRWVDRIHTEDRVMRLRVLEDQLGRHVRRDLPVLLHTLESDYFLLTLQHGPTRAEGPVDVFLWDLKGGRPLLRTRTESKGILLPVRVDMGDAPGTTGKLDPRTAGANDCSIASQVKSLTGEPPIMAGTDTAETLQKRPPPSAPDAGLAHDGGTGSSPQDQRAKPSARSNSEVEK
jgi:hypothetical protein